MTDWNRLSYRLPFVRGNDGLTGRQRRKYARRWAQGAGKRMSRDEAEQLAALARSLRDA